MLGTEAKDYSHFAEAQPAAPDMDEQDVVTSLSDFDGLWASLFPAEQARIARLLIDRVIVSQQGLTVDLRTDGLSSVVRDMLAPRQKGKAA